MSVLIKGMEIPKSCDKCELMTANYGCAFVGSVGGESYRKRAWDCPLVEVPTTHGRLIDAEAIPWIEGKDEQDKPIYLLLKFQVEELPTIIESEKT